MKIKVLYWEIKEKEFRSKKSLSEFLKKAALSKIELAVEYRKGIKYYLDLRKFINEYIGYDRSNNE